jgi:hypothetical protein
MQQHLPDNIVIETTPQGNATKWKVIGFSLGAVGLVVTYFYIRKKILQRRADEEEKKALDEGEPALYAQQIKMAFENDGYGWWRSDIAMLRQIIEDIPSKQMFRQVNDSYTRLFPGRSMIRDMKINLKSTEYDDIRLLVAAKPETAVIDTHDIQYKRWARRLRDAFNLHYGWYNSNDNEAVEAVFNEIPSKHAYKKVVIAYKTLYHRDLESDYKSEVLWHFWQKNHLDIISSKPDY